MSIRPVKKIIQSKPTLEGSRNSQAGNPGPVGRQQDVAWVQYAVLDVDRRITGST